MFEFLKDKSSPPNPYDTWLTKTLYHDRRNESYEQQIIDILCDIRNFLFITILILLIL